MTQYTCGMMSDLKEVLIELPSTPKQIGVMFSGGADSSILLYLICKENERLGNIHRIVPLTVAKIDGALFYAKAVLDHFRTELGIDLPQPLVVGNPYADHDKQVSSGIADTVGFGFCDVLFVGENQNPPEPFVMKGMYPNRLKTNPYNPEQIRFPFLHLYKTHTIDLFHQFGLEKLLSITHSCTAGPTGRCMECFACDERSWALKLLRKPDINAYPN